MTTTRWIIELGRSSWRLDACREDAAPVTIAGEFVDSRLVEQTETIRTALVENGYSGEPTVVALDSHWCLTANLRVTRAAELRDRQTMLYRFEECIPWSAEEFVADYLHFGNEALMVAAPASPLSEFLHALESRGVFIQSIVPTALLACVEHVASTESPGQHLVAFEVDGRIDLIRVADCRPQSWSAIPVHGNGFRTELQQHALAAGHALPLAGYGLSDSTVADIQASAAASILHSALPSAASVRDLVQSVATKILDGRLEAPIELKRGRFGRCRGHVALRPYAVALQAAVGLLAASLMAVFIYRGHLAARETEMIAEKQVAIFRSTFPNVKVPVGIEGRLESELAKLKGLQGGDSSVPSKVSAIAILHDLMAALPTDRRFVLLEIRIEEGRIYLDGEVREHGDAEALAQRLRANGFEVASPRTQRQDDKHVTLRITGSRASIVKVASGKK